MSHLRPKLDGTSSLSPEQLVLRSLNPESLFVPVTNDHFDPVFHLTQISVCIDPLMDPFVPQGICLGENFEAVQVEYTDLQNLEVCTIEYADL